MHGPSQQILFQAAVMRGELRLILIAVCTVVLLLCVVLMTELLWFIHK